MLRTSEFILNFILNSCWQIAVIFAIAALGAWLLKNGPARYRHAVWIAALTAGLVVPLRALYRLGFRVFKSPRLQLRLLMLCLRLVQTI